MKIIHKLYMPRGSFGAKDLQFFNLCPFILVNWAKYSGSLLVIVSK